MSPHCMGAYINCCKAQSSVLMIHLSFQGGKSLFYTEVLLPQNHKPNISFTNPFLKFLKVFKNFTWSKEQTTDQPTDKAIDICMWFASRSQKLQLYILICYHSLVIHLCISKQSQQLFFVIRTQITYITLCPSVVWLVCRSFGWSAGLYVHRVIFFKRSWTIITDRWTSGTMAKRWLIQMICGSD